MKQSDQTLFFGCENFQAHSNKSYTIDLEKGISMLKSKNKLELSEIEDLDDEY